MNTRELGNTHYPVSEIGFGAWAIGADWGEEVPEKQAREALNAAFDAGMNFVDTADVYGAGRSERIVGAAVKERDERIYVATKMGRFDGWKPTYDAIARAAEASCERLGVDCLDLVQLHCIPTETLMAGTVFDHLEKVVDAGLVRHYGASVESIDEGLFCIRNSGCVTLQVIFNLFRQRVVRDLLQAAAVNNIGIIARVPLASGVLSGKFTADHAFGRRDHRGFNANGELFNVGETFAGVPFKRGVEFAAEFGSMLADECGEGATPSQQALRWILDHPGVSTVIPGVKSVEQACENAAAAGLPEITTAAHERVRDYYWSEIDCTVRGVY